MKKRYYLFALCMLPAILIAAPKKNKTETWIDASVQLKTEVVNCMLDADMPVFLTDVKKGELTPIVANVTNQKLIVLSNKLVRGRTKNVTIVWNNARLTKADGSIVYLDDFLDSQVTFRKGNIRKNTLFNGKPIKFNTKTQHALGQEVNTVIAYKLNKEYVKFEAEIGIPNNSSIAGVRCEVCNVLPANKLAKMEKEYYAHGMLEWCSFARNLEDWSKSIDASYELQILERIVKNFKEPAYFKMKIDEIKSMPNNSDKYCAALELFENLHRVKILSDDLKWLNITAIEMAFSDMKKNKKFNAAKYTPMLVELQALCKKGFSGIYREDQGDVVNLKRALELKRRILFANPLLETNKIVVSNFQLGATARTAMAPQMGTPKSNFSNQESASRSGYDAAIVELSDWDKNIKKRIVYKPTNSSPIADLKLHWDGDRVMFTATQADNRWNSWEAYLDGSSVKPMVKIPESDIEFYDGTYLPDGRFIAISNIGYQGVPCVSGDDPVGNMVLCDKEKGTFRRITFDQDANWGPTVMNNGKVMYTRWEYTDLMHYYSRFVMSMNPDGTEQKALSGSGSAFPNSMFDIQALPGRSSAFVATVTGHHGIARSGRMLMFDPTKARSGVEGVMHEIPKRGLPIDGTVKDSLVQYSWPHFTKPMPIDDKYYLVAAKLSPIDLWGVYLVDVFDNITCIAKGEGEGYISPILVRKVPTPPIIPDRVKLNEKEATVFIQDIYEGEGLRGVPRGVVKKLRLHSYEYAYIKSSSDHNAHGIQSGWDIKRLLGTVPVEEDGSAIFKIPANTPISIQPLDENGAAIQWMRSWLTGQPGEIVSCIGCHEDQNEVPVPKRVIASQRAPHAITLPTGGVHAISFDLDVQPILDRSCIACHDGNRAFDLRGGKKDGKGYGTSYLNLHPYVHRQGSEADMAVLQPYEYYANTSELILILKKGHANVQLTDEEWKSLYNWIDYNAPDNASFQHTKPKFTPYKGLDQYKRRIELTNKYGCGMGVDYKKELADYAAYLKAKGPIVPVVNKAPKRKDIKTPKVKDWPIAFNDYDVETKVIELSPSLSMTFVKIPAGKLVMGSNDGDKDNQPAMKADVKKSFWMAEVEVTNEQFTAFFPEHDSRYVDQQWKDHIHYGYPANLSHQPVIRVSYNQAVEFCDVLSKKTGLKVTLPTEMQWEWACRAGSEENFWYGTLTSDFAKKENFADKQTLKMAVVGVDPQPIPSTHSAYKYQTYLPKEKNVDDGAMIQVDSKMYEANPFGLYSMHGNIAEWTKSDYTKYGNTRHPICLNCKLKKSACVCSYKVVRGGSYIERPKFGTSYARKAYLSHQRVFNVGFRVIIEE